MLKTLNELYNFYETESGIFDFIEELVPWEDVLNSSMLNQDFFYNHSGFKFAAPGVMFAFEKAGEEGITIAKRSIALMLYQKYSKKWERLWEVYTSEYNPIHNYDMTEIETNGVIETASRNGSRNNTNSITRSINAQDKDYVFGFNSQSTDRNPSSIYDSQTSDTNSESLAEITANSDTHNRNDTRNLTRSGNIGVTTNQQMLQSQIDLWKWNFIEEVYSDVDEFMTIPFYDPCMV